MGDSCANCGEGVDVAIGAHHIQCLICGRFTRSDGSLEPEGENPTVSVPITT